MNWTDTVGITIHNELVRHALKNKPDADVEKLERSITHMSLSVGITREAISKVLDAEIQAMITYKVLGDKSITVDYISGLQSASDLVRYGVHLSDVSK